jgi:hypothetical protein
MLWLLKNWKSAILIVSLLALSITGVGLYHKGKAVARQEQQIVSLQTDLNTAKAVIKNEQEARLNDAILATEAAKRQAALSTKIDELNQYVDTLQDADRECLTGADTERLRDLWK